MPRGVIVLLLLIPFNRAFSGHSAASNASRLGAVSFAVSCPSSNAAFERGLALLHSFEYKPARDQFQEIERQSSGCAIAYWGDAMTYYHQLWDRPSAEDVAAGWRAVQKAQSAHTANEHEKAYVTAAAAFYRGDAKRTFNDRWASYSEAMQQVTKSFPADQEAAAFYALSLIASPHAADNGQALRKQAVAILQPPFKEEPHHPGLAHYLIHACDNPEMAQQGLAAARVYASIAPDSPHALHMPSHIFARLGLWKDDIQSNLAAEAAADKIGERGHGLHAMDFLEYAYLQTGQNEEAREVVDEAKKLESQPAHEHGKGPSPAWVSVHFPGTYALETGAWKEALAVRANASDAPEWRALAVWTHAVAAGHLRDKSGTESALRDLESDLEEVRHTSYAYVADDMAELREEAQAWSDFAHDRLDDATGRLEKVAAKQDAVGKSQTEIPAREMLADMLLLSDRSADALREYRASLKTDPNRRRSLEGAKEAATLSKQNP